MRSIFHWLIIAMFTLGLSACGYKAPPFYLEEEILVGDENVEFKVKKLDTKKSETCDKEK